MTWTKEKKIYEKRNVEK